MAWTVGREYPFVLRVMMAQMPTRAWNLLVLQIILEIHLSATFDGKVVLNTRAYQYYDCQTGRVHGYPAWRRSETDLFRTIDPRFLLVQWSTLADCKAEVPRCAVETGVVLKKIVMSERGGRRQKSGRWRCQCCGAMYFR